MTDQAEPISESTAAPDEDWEWAIVEVFGHRRHAGRIREEERFGAKMLRIDVPVFEAIRGMTPPVIDGTPRWETLWYGGSSIFSLSLTDEATVMRANKPYESPYRLRVPDLTPEDELGDTFDGENAPV